MNAGIASSDPIQQDFRGTTMESRVLSAPLIGHDFFSKMRQRFCHDQWNVGVVHQAATDIVRRGLVAPVNWLSAPPAWTFLADPSCRRRADGGLDLFAERMDYWRGKGAIWAARLPPGADPAMASFSPLFGHGAHLSYPFPFVADDGQAYLTTESWEAQAALIWREGAGGWSPVATLFGGRPVVDPTLWRGEDRWWLFCTFQDDGPNQRLHMFHAPAADGPWTPHRGNPVIDDAASARPAGPLFWADGTLVRPSQDNSGTYGGALVLNAVVSLDANHYGEEPIRRLVPREPYPNGLHTFYPAGEYTLVDGKRRQFHLLEPARRILERFQVRRRLRKLGDQRPFQSSLNKDR
jgi:hypothetical protein